MSALSNTMPLTFRHSSTHTPRLPGELLAQIIAYRVKTNNDASANSPTAYQNTTDLTAVSRDFLFRVHEIIVQEEALLLDKVAYLKEKHEMMCLRAPMFTTNSRVSIRWWLRNSRKSMVAIECSGAGSVSQHYFLLFDAP